MKRIFRLFIALNLFVALFATSYVAKAAGTEPTVSVKLANYLGNQSSITVEPSETYVIENSSLLLEKGKSYYVKVQSSGVALYDGSSKLADFASFKAIPSTYSATLSINGRKYLGDMQFTNEGGKYVRPVNTVPMEDYLKGVVPKEIYTSWALDALKAQALAARTYAMTYVNRTVIDDTQNYQVYGGYEWHERTTQAVDETFGQVVTYNGALAQTVFSSSNGGYIESSYNYWGKTKLPYLEAKQDPYDPQRAWSQAITKKQLDLTGKDLKNPSAWWDAAKEVDLIMANNIRAKMQAIGFANKDIKIISVDDIKFYEPTTGQRATKGDLTVKYVIKDQFDESGNLKISTWNLVGEKASSLKTMLNGIKMLNLYVTSIKSSEQSIVIEGKGYGHGVGLSQYGASSMASQGKSYREIISFYYPGTAITMSYNTKYPRSYVTIPPAPSAPTANVLTTDSTAVQGKAAAGSDVYVKNGSTVIGQGKADANGNYTITIVKQPANAHITITAKNLGGESHASCCSRSAKSTSSADR